MTFDVYQANWSWQPQMERWVKKQCVGRTLNFPCGMSRLGDVRADIDPRVKPDVIANLEEPFKTFARSSFDTVVCDPPFSMYNHQQWVLELSEIARKRFMISSPMLLRLSPGVWKRDVRLCVGPTFFMRVWFIFDRMVHQFTGEVLPSTDPEPTKTPV